MENVYDALGICLPTISTDAKSEMEDFHTHAVSSPPHTAPGDRRHLCSADDTHVGDAVLLRINNSRIAKVENVHSSRCDLIMS